MKPNPTFSLPLGPAARKALKALAHHLDPVVIVGDAGPTAAVIAETRRALAAHELIKIRVRGDDRAARDACLKLICETTGAAPVQRIGKLLVIYLPRPVEAETAKGPYIPKKRAAVGAGPKPRAPRRAPSAPAKTPRSPARSPARSTIGSTRTSTRTSVSPTRAPARSATGAPRTPARSTGTLRTPTRSTGTTRTPTRSTGTAPRATTRSSTSPARPPRAGAPRSRSAPAGTRAPQRGGVRRGPKKS